MEKKLTSLEKLLMKRDEPVASTSGLQHRTSSSEESGEDDCEPEDSQEMANCDPPNAETSRTPKVAPKKQRIQRSKIPTYLRGLMGEANLRFARGDCETAEKMCFEVIRQFPDAYEPYLTLAQLYENDYPAKSFQYYCLAAHMKPNDFDLWERIAEANMAMGNPKEALRCYTNATNANPKNIKIQKKRIELLESLNDTKAALRCKVRLAQSLKRTKHDQIIKLSIKVAQQYHEMHDYARAVDAMSVPFKRCPEHITPELVNMLLELLLICNRYSKCLDIFLEFCNIEIEIVLQENDKIKVLSFVMPENLQVDLKIKFVVCLIKLESFDVLPLLTDRLLIDEDVEIVGDLFLDVAEAFMSVKQPEKALSFLIPLVKSKNFSLAAVWLKHAECLKACGLLEQAAESYYKVMSLAPQHVEVRYPLAMILLQLDRKQEALSVVSQNAKTQTLDARILIEKLRLLKEMDDYKAYCKAAELLLSRHCTIIRHPEELRAVIYGVKPNQKIVKLRKMREFRGETLEPKPIFMSEHEPTLEEEIAILREILDTCKTRQDYATMQKFAFSALSSNRFRRKLYDVLVFAFFACLYNRDAYHGYSVIREIVSRYLENHLGWNLLMVILQRGEDVRYHKFIMRLLKSFAVDPILSILDANYGVIGGNYNYSIQILMPLFRKVQPPFLCLMLGVAMLPFCGPTEGMDKKKLTTTVLGLFAKYADGRGALAVHEVKYNLGRMFHQLGVVHVAEGFYKDVLEYSHPLIDKYPEILCLKREAAFNLHVIYKECENYDAARDVLMRYIVI